MSQNPYQAPSYKPDAPPTQKDTAPYRLSPEKLQSIASIQKALIVFIALRIIGFVIALSLPPEIGGFVMIATYFIAILSTITVVLLAMQVYTVGQGILYGLLSLIPCIGLIVLLQVNGEATKTLQENGIKVGLFGAKDKIQV